MNNGQPMYGQPMYVQPVYAPPKKKSALKIILGILGGLIGIFIILAIIGFVTSKKLKCNVGDNSFTVYYTDSTIIGCFTKGNAYCDLDTLKSNAKIYGVEKVIETLRTTSVSQGATCTN